MNELLGLGLIDRHPSPDDRRAFALHLTDQGKSLLDECGDRIRAHEARCLAALSQAEQRLLLDFLGRISAGANGIAPTSEGTRR